MTTSAAATRSLWSITATVILAAITHAYDFGIVAFAAGAIVIAMLFVTNSHYRRTGSRLAAACYGLLSLWVIIGFGLVGGVWNHAVKVAISAANGGMVPPALDPLFMDPELGGVTYETLWILLGVAGVLAAFFGYQFARTVRWTPRADARGRGVA